MSAPDSKASNLLSLVFRRPPTAYCVLNGRARLEGVETIRAWSSHSVTGSVSNFVPHLRMIEHPSEFQLLTSNFSVVWQADCEPSDNCFNNSLRAYQNPKRSDIPVHIEQSQPFFGFAEIPGMSASGG